MKKLFVWDFHGTLEKDNEYAAIEISNYALEKLGFKEHFDRKHAVQLYGKKWYEYFEYLLPNEPHKTHVLLQETSFNWPEAEAIVAKHMKPNDHVQEVLKAIKDIGHSQIVISNTSTYALPIFLRLAGIDKFFDNTTSFAVMGHVREVKRSKADVIKEYLKSLNFKPTMVVIGDSEKDMQIAKQFGAKGYWYRHTHHPSPKARKNTKFTVINNLREVLKEV